MEHDLVSVIIFVSAIFLALFFVAALWTDRVLREIRDELRRIDSTDSQDFRVSSTQRGSLK